MVKSDRGDHLGLFAFAFACRALSRWFSFLGRSSRSSDLCTHSVDARQFAVSLQHYRHLAGRGLIFCGFVNGSTRWEWEAYGQFSMSGAIELARFAPLFLLFFIIASALC